MCVMCLHGAYGEFDVMISYTVDTYQQLDNVGVSGLCFTRCPISERRIFNYSGQ